MHVTHRGGIIWRYTPQGVPRAYYNVFSEKAVVAWWPDVYTLTLRHF